MSPDTVTLVGAIIDTVGRLAFLGILVAAVLSARRTGRAQATIKQLQAERTAQLDRRQADLDRLDRLQRGQAEAREDRWTPIAERGPHRPPAPWERGLHRDDRWPLPGYGHHLTPDGRIDDGHPDVVGGLED